jgi:hypothetical protein
LQVKELILTEVIFCPPDFSVLLASYAMQVKYGDYEEEAHKVGFITTERLLPPRVISQFKMDAEDWESRIKECWFDHKGMTRENAMVDYLKVAQDMDMYGVNVSYFGTNWTHLFFSFDTFLVLRNS